MQATINRFQDPATGLYLAQSFEPHFQRSGPPVLNAHDHEHTTAFATAALVLIDRRPAHPLTLILGLQANRSAWLPWLANTAHVCGLDGKQRCASWDHRSAGVFASLTMTKQLTPQFREFFFSWLDANADNVTGYACADSIPYSGEPQVGWMTCYAHISWQYVYEQRPWPNAAKMVDTGLLMQNKTTGYMCVNPHDQAIPGKESPQCKATCTPTEPCSNSGCCGSASPVHPSCHQLDGLWTVTRSRYRSVYIHSTSLSLSLFIRKLCLTQHFGWCHRSSYRGCMQPPSESLSERRCQADVRTIPRLGRYRAEQCNSDLATGRPVR